MQVIKGKVKKVSNFTVPAGISNNVGAENREKFVQEAVKDNAIRCRSLAGFIRKGL